MYISETSSLSDGFLSSVQGCLLGSKQRRINHPPLLESPDDQQDLADGHRIKKANDRTRETNGREAGRKGGNGYKKTLCSFVGPPNASTSTICSVRKTQVLKLNEARVRKKRHESGKRKARVRKKKRHESGKRKARVRKKERHESGKRKARVRKKKGTSQEKQKARVRKKTTSQEKDRESGKTEGTSQEKNPRVRKKPASQEETGARARKKPKNPWDAPRPALPRAEDSERVSDSKQNS